MEKNSKKETEDLEEKIDELQHRLADTKAKKIKDIVIKNRKHIGDMFIKDGYFLLKIVGVDLRDGELICVGVNFEDFEGEISINKRMNFESLKHIEEKEFIRVSEKEFKKKFQMLSDEKFKKLFEVG